MLENRTIDKNIPIPLYFQLKTIILEEIKNGSFSKDGMIPTENELVSMFDISRTTVRQAITELVQEGHLYRIKSKGTFVAKPKIAFRLLSNVYEKDVKESGMGDVRMEVLAFEERPIPDFLPELIQATEGEKKTIYLERLRIANDIPICLVKSYLRADLFQGMLGRDMTKASLHELMMETKGMRADRLYRCVEAINGDRELCKKLSLETGGAIQLLTTHRYNLAGTLLDISYGYYRGDMNRVEFEIDNPSN